MLLDIITFTCCSPHRLVSDAGPIRIQLSPPAHLGERGVCVCVCVCAGCHHSFGPKSAVAALSRRVSPAPSLSPSFAPSSLFFRSGEKAQPSASGALTLSVSWLSLRSQWRFIFLLMSLLCGRELPAPAFLKACHGLEARGAGKREHVEATLICW